MVKSSKQRRTRQQPGEIGYIPDVKISGQEEGKSKKKKRKESRSAFKVHTYTLNNMVHVLSIEAGL